MPTFAEQLLLLATDEGGAPLPVQEDALACALAGAVLMDLAFAERIDTDMQALVVLDERPTGTTSLDRVLAKIAARQAPANARVWIRELSVDDAGAIAEDVLSGLVERGALAGPVERLRGHVRTRRPGTASGEAVRRVRRRIRQVLRANDIPHPRDIALVALLDACDLLADIFPAEEIAPRGARIRQLRRMDLIGRELTGAINDIEREIIAALRARAARRRTLLLHLSIIAGLGATAALLAPRIPAPHRIAPSWRQSLWFDEAWQQWSGYLLLAFGGVVLLAAMFVKVRSAARLGSGQLWRLAHVGFGVGCALLLFAHTGFRLGANLNAALMVCFLAVLFFGALAGIATNGAPGLRRLGVTPMLRATLLRLHRAALYPLPALLAIHILIVYMY